MAVTHRVVLRPSPSQIKGTDDFCPPLEARVADVTGFIVTMIYWFLVCDRRHGEEHIGKQKKHGRQAAVASECQAPKQVSSRVSWETGLFFPFFPSLLASGYCLAICLVSLRCWYSS